MAILGCLGCLGCLSWVLLAVAGGGSQAIEVHGDSVCPSAAQVGAALTGLVATSEPTASPDTVELRRDAGSLMVELRRGSGELVGQRRLPEGGSCPDRAQTAAVLIAAWEVQLQSGDQPSLPEPAATPETTPAPETTPTRIPEAIATQPSSLVAGPAPPKSAVPISNGAREAPPVAIARQPSTLATPEQPQGRPLEIEVNAALLAAVAGADLAPAASLNAALARRGSRLSLGVGALVVGTHATTVEPGAGTWRRLGGVIDLGLDSSLAGIGLQGHVGLALTALEINGRSLPSASGATLFDPGALAGVRARLRSGRFVPWIEATVAAWPRQHLVYVMGGAGASAELPRWEALLGLGVTIGSAR